MFLFPAIGAWISDGLVLYIHFSQKGSHGGGATNHTDSWGGGLGGELSVVCGNSGMAPCRRLQILETQSKPTTAENVVSFPGVPSEDETQDNSIYTTTDDEAGTSTTAPTNNTDGSADEHKTGISAATVESKTGYLSVLAIIRLVLLTFPLSYAAYSGTRVPCAIAQYLFQGISAMVVVSHMMAVLILDPGSLAVPGDTVDPTGWRKDDGNDTPFGSDEGDSSFGDAWTLLSLSLVSILLHFLIVLHVRSTGPVQEGLYEEKRKRKRMAYAMTAQSNGAARGGRASSPLLGNGHHHDDNDDEEMADGTSSPLLMSGNLSRKKSIKERFMCLPDQYEMFVSDTQARFDAARRMWADRLDIMTRSLQQNNNGNNSSHGEERPPAFESPPRNLESSNLLSHAINTTKLVPLRPDPFRVLLQLFAYEDVFSGTHNRLDLAFAAAPAGTTSDGALVAGGGNAALSFYAPQILSFLLHGAYFDISAQLEEWVLKKCSEDLHFAHRCFWFLRSWCLGGSSVVRNPSHAHSLSSSSLGGIAGIDLSPLDAEPAQKLRGEEIRLETSRGMIIQGQLYGSIDGTAVDDFGPGGASSNGFSSPSELATAVEQGLVPVDPRTGHHSTAHLDCITAAHKHGFLPLNSAGELLHPSNDATSLFFAAPVFLDALLSVADDLMDTSKSIRTVELRQRLRSLEVELLPSNVVYLPIQNMSHRVWRIVSDESLALSTNERVPCIVTLEVLDCSAPGQQANSSPNDETAITSAWVKTPRPPHRHSTLMDKVAGGWSEGLKRLEDTFDHLHLSHHGDGKAKGLDRRISDLLGGSKESPLYTALGSADEDDEEEHEGSELSEMKASEDDKWRKRPSSPLGSPLKSDNIDAAPETPRARSPLTIETDDAQQQPRQSPMGQWATPKKKSTYLRKRHNMDSIEDISEEEESEEDASPQGKQRKRVAFPPLMASMSRSESGSDDNESPTPSEPGESSNVEAAVTNGVAPTVVFKEDWKAKTERLRKSSVYGSHPGWRLLPILVKSNDDLRQEQLASQLIQRMALILAKARVPVWLYPYEIIAVTGRGGIIECVPDTISLDSLKRNDPDFTGLKSFFEQHFGVDSDRLADAKANFVESLAAYSIICFLLQIKDRHNGNILLTNKGHLVHIDFGFFFLSSPGKNSGFESAPFKLTRDFVALMDGPDSRSFMKFRELGYKTFIELRKHCYQIIILVEMLSEGNEDLACFRGSPEKAVMELKQRFRLDLNDNGVRKYVDSLIDESLENWRTRWYDRYQRFCVGVL
ncbi:hypothetical protein ACHAXT_010185 [Thalassiosira profunda]